MEEAPGKYYCKSCSVSSDAFNVVYMFAMRVEDGTAGMWVHVFGDIGTELMSKTAEEIKKKKDAGEDWQELFDQQKNKVRLFNGDTAVFNRHKILEILYEGENVKRSL